MAFDGITLRAIGNQLNHVLKEGKIDKITQAENDEILLTIRSNQKNYKLLLSANSSNPRVYLTSEYQKENPLQAPLFLMILRKHIGSGRILSIKQAGMERILEINIASYDEMRILKEKKLIIEIMGKHSNIILVDSESNNVIDSIKRVSLTMSSVREVLPNRSYILPPSQNKKSLLDDLTIREFTDLATHPPQAAYKSIYQNFIGISPVVAKELCYRTNIDYDQNTSSLDDIKIEKLYSQLIRLKQQIVQGDFNPCIIKDKNSGKVIDFSSIYLSHLEEFKLIENSDISYITEQYYITKDTKERIAQRTQGLRKSIQLKLDRLKNKYQKQQEEMLEATELDNFKKIGDLLTAHIYVLKHGMEQITVTDYFDEAQPEITITLDKRQTPSGNIQSYFKKYTKAKSRIKELTEQIKHTKDDLDYLENIMLSIANADNLQEIDEIKRELYKEGFSNHNIDGKKSKKQHAPSSPLEFMSSDGTLIFVGKNNTQNDIVTFQIAEPTDVWLHTKDIPGSHVIIKGVFEEITDQTVREAAIIAAYYSKARQSDKVPVDYTTRKNIKKPNSAKPGFVIYETNSTTYAKPDQYLVEKLMIKKE